MAETERASSRSSWVAFRGADRFSWIKVFRHSRARLFPGTIGPDQMKIPSLSHSSPWRRELPLAFVLASILLWLWPVVVGNSTLFFRDLYLQHVGTARLLAGESPVGFHVLWDTLLNGGQPLLGNPNRFILYPSRLLYRVFPTVTALNLEIVAHLILGILGIYLLVRCLGVGPWPAALAAFAWSLGGISVSLTNHLGRFLAFQWMPWAVLAAERLVREQRREQWWSRWWFAVLAAFSLQWLTGGFEVVLITGVMVIIWVLGRARRGFRRAAWVRVISAMVIAPFLVGFQLIPMVVMVLRSGRKTLLSPSSVLFWSVHPFRLVEAIVPGFFGPIDIPELTGRYWGEHLVDKGVPYFLTLYLGVTVILLAILGARRGEDRLLRRFLAVTVLVGTILALGRYVPGAKWFVSTFHRLFIVRYPVKAMILVALPVAVLAAVGLHALNSRQSKALLFRLSAAASVLFLAAWATLKTSPVFSTHVLTVFFEGADPGMVSGVAVAFGHVALVSILMMLLLMMPTPKWLGPALVLLTAVDLVTSAGGYLPRGPRWMLAQPPPVVELVASRTDAGRLYRVPDPIPHVLHVPADRAWGGAVAQESILVDYLGATYGIPMVFHRDDPKLASARYSKLLEKVRTMPLGQLRSLFELANVQTVLSPGPPRVPWLEGEVFVPAMAEGRYTLTRTTFPHRTVWFVPEARWVATVNDATDVVCMGNFDPGLQVVLEKPRSFPRLSFGPSELLGQFEAVAPSNGWLYIAIPWAPGMETYIDGQLVAPVIADVAFMAVPVSPGQHELRLLYRPPELTVGILVSLITLVGLVAGSAVLRRRQQD